MDDYKEPEKDVALRAEIDTLIADARTVRDDFMDGLNENLQLYMGAHESIFGGDVRGRYMSVNRIASSINVKSSVLNEIPVRPIILPREIGGEPDVFFKPDAMDIIPPQVLAVIQDIPGVDEEVLEGEKPMPYAAFQAMMGAAGEDGERVLDENDFIVVDEQLVADALTQELHGQMARAGFDEWIERSNHDKLVYGWQDSIIQWDHDKQCIRFEPLYPYAVFIDKLATSTADAGYVIIRDWMPIDKAKIAFPDNQEEIMRYATSTPSDPHMTTGDSLIMGDRYAGNTSRSYVPITTAWLRNVEYDFSVDEALDMGLVSFAEDEDMDGNPFQKMDENGNALFILHGDDEEDDKEITEGSKDWPSYSGIRQVTMIGDFILHDGESEFSDIPVARNKNILIPDSPYAIGDPEYLRDLQDLYSRLWSIFYEHFMFYRFPTQYIPKSVYNDIGQLVRQSQQIAGLQIPVDDELLMMTQGQVVQQVQIPQISASVANLIEQIGREIDTVAGTINILRGAATGEMSGALFESASINARGVIQQSARHTEQFLRHLIRVAVNLIADYMTDAEWSRRNRKYPAQVLASVREKARQLDYDLEIQVTGADHNRMSFDKLAMIAQTNPNLFNSPTFVKVLMDKARVPDGEKIANELLDMMRQAQQPPAQ